MNNNGYPKFISAQQKRRILAGDIPPWMLKHIRSDYIIKCFLSTPLWVKRSDFADLVRMKERETLATGVPHVLDHICPVTHPNACGLTVPWNMQVVPKAVNAAKSNKWFPDQMLLPLLKAVEQLPLHL